MLDLGVTPSQVSLQGSSGKGESREEVDLPPGEEQEREKGGEEGEEEPRSYCIPLQSLGLGGNKITCLGAASLADGLKTNTSK